MISPIQVKRWRKRALRDCATLKRWPDSKIDGYLASRSVSFITDPYRHQRISLALVLRMKALLLLLDMGLGKTKIMLDAFRARERTQRLLVLVPNTVNLYGWRDQVHLHTPGMDVGLVTGQSDEKMKDFNAPIVVCTYSGWMHLNCEKVKKSKGQKMVVNQARLREMCKGFDMVVYDESTAFKNHRSVAFDLARRMIPLIPYRYALTGTPFGRDPQDLWSQFYAVDSGESLGQTLTLFRQAFFKARRNYWGGYEYTFIKKRGDQLNRMMRARSIHYEVGDCVDLPDKVMTLVRVDFSREGSDWYSKTLSKVREAKGNLALMKNVFVRMRQITAGFIATLDDEGERVEFELAEKPKLDALESLIYTIPANRSVIIFHQYLHSGKLIMERLRKCGVKAVQLVGKTKDKAGVQTSFQTGKVKVLVANETAAYGLNLQVANYVIFFESPVSPIMRSQMERRVYRVGQSRKVFIYDLVINSSVDERILDYVEQGKNFFDLLVQGRAEA